MVAEFMGQHTASCDGAVHEGTCLVFTFNEVHCPYFSLRSAHVNSVTDNEMLFDIMLC